MGRGAHGRPPPRGPDELRTRRCLVRVGRGDQRARHGRRRRPPRTGVRGRALQPHRAHLDLRRRPVHDPHSGRLLGAVDITGGNRLAHPHSLAFVQAVARAAESQLALLGPPPAASRTASPAVELRALGLDEALLTTGGRTLRLSRRHSELVVLLACHPEGMTGDELLVALYEDEHTTPVTLRAELSRLRRALGDGLLRSRPYRLTAPVTADFDTVLRHLAGGAPAAAVTAYRGPLLPSSRAPAVLRLRDRVDGQLRAALLARRDPELLSAWTGSPWGAEDLEAWAALAAVLPQGSPRAPLVLQRVRELDAEQSGFPVR